MNAIKTMVASVVGAVKSVWIYWLLMGTHIAPLYVAYNARTNKFVVGVNAESLTVLARNGVTQRMPYSQMRRANSRIGKHLAFGGAKNNTYSNKYYGERNFRSQPVLSKLLQDNRILFSDYRSDENYVSNSTVMSILSGYNSDVTFAVGD